MCKCENGELTKYAGDNKSKTMCAILGHLSAAAAVAAHTYAVISQLVNRLGHLIRLGCNKKWKMETGAASCSDEYPQQITIIYARSHSMSSGTGWQDLHGGTGCPSSVGRTVREYMSMGMGQYNVIEFHHRMSNAYFTVHCWTYCRQSGSTLCPAAVPAALHTNTSTDPRQWQRQRVGRQTGSWKASSHVDGSWFAVRLMGHISHFLRFRLFNGHGVSWRRSILSTVHCPMPIPVYGYWFLL